MIFLMAPIEAAERARELLEGLDAEAGKTMFEISASDLRALVENQAPGSWFYVIILAAMIFALIVFYWGGRIDERKKWEKKGRS